MGTNPVQRGATADTVSANVKRLRRKQNLGLRGLAGKLAEVGRPLTHSAVDQIEQGGRRVDVDDLMALAAALGVSPVTLLMPESTTRDDLVEVTGFPPERAGDVWDWLRALYLRHDHYYVLVESNPSWAFPDALLAANLRAGDDEVSDGDD
jgi:transcriptional regulator with XRE-family HTH domain